MRIYREKVYTLSDGVTPTGCILSGVTFLSRVLVI